MKHTKGEWKATPQRGIIGHCTVAQIWTNKKERSIANITSCDTEDEANANAKLIAAAPELLESCNKAIEIIKLQINDWETIPYVVDIKKAIQKATQ